MAGRPRGAPGATSPRPRPATEIDFVDVLAPGASGAALDAIRHRTEFPRDRQVFRVVALHRDGTPIPLEVHGGPLLRDGRMIGRMGICRVLASAQRDDGTAAQAGGAHGLQGERMRIARGLRDAIAQVVFGVTADGDATESFLSDVKRATVDEVARRLRLDEVDLEILGRITAGDSNREIAVAGHLSPAAVKDRVRRLMDRLGARRRAELAAHALRLGIA
jgi:DNA-binding CsgD family transcriptional regulator